jgi:hypothetical protein
MVITPVLPAGIDFSKYLGQWIVVYEKKIIAHNKDLKKIKKEINSCKRTPTIAKIPEKETLIF